MLMPSRNQSCCCSGSPPFRSATAFLYRDRAFDGVDHAWKFHQGAVAGELDDPAAMGADGRLDQLFPQRPETLVRTFLVGLHQPAVADHVGGQDRGQAPLAGRGHGFAPGRAQERRPITSRLIPGRFIWGTSASYRQRASPARALGLALLQAIHVGIFRQLRLGRAHGQPGLAVAVEEQVQPRNRAHRCRLR